MADYRTAAISKGILQEQTTSTSKSEESVEDEDEDPLDAFMADIEVSQSHEYRVNDQY